MCFFSFVNGKKLQTCNFYKTIFDLFHQYTKLKNDNTILIEAVNNRTRIKTIMKIFKKFLKSVC